MLYDGAKELRSGKVRVDAKPGDVGGIDVGMPQHDRVALDVDAAAPGAPVSWVYSPGVNGMCCSPLNFTKRLEHHRACRHVDAQSQCLRGEYGLHQSGGEQLLDGVAENRQHSGVVGGQPAQQSLAPFVVVEHDQVGLGSSAAAPVDHLGDAGALLVRGEPQRRPQALLDRGVAAGPGEDERDCGQQTFAVRATPITSGRARRPVEGSGGRGTGRDRAAASRPAGPPRRRCAMWRSSSGSTSSSRPDFAAPGRAVVEQVEQPLADHHVLPQRNRSVFVDDDGGVAAHRLDPAAELLGVAHRRRQADQPHLVGQVQDHLLPHRTAHPVGQEVHLVHDDVGKSVQCRRIRVQHVAQHFGGHHHDVGVAVDRLVAGEQADALRRRTGAPDRCASDCSAP